MIRSIKERGKINLDEATANDTPKTGSNESQADLLFSRNNDLMRQCFLDADYRRIPNLALGYLTPASRRSVS